MYGLLLYSAFECLKQLFGLEMARQIVDSVENRETALQNGSSFLTSPLASLSSHGGDSLSEQPVNFTDEALCPRANNGGGGRSAFAFHQLYSDKLLARLASAAHKKTKMPLEEILEHFGRSFVQFCRKSGYDVVLKSIGRSLRDFIMSLDNVHEYFRATYPKMRPPSFAIVQEDPDGFLIQYRSTRGGFENYVIGQLKEVAHVYFGMKIDATVITKEEHDDGVMRGRVSTLIKLEFDNMKQFDDDTLANANCVDDIRGRFLRADVLMSNMPFYVTINRDLEILSIGSGIKAALPSIVGEDFLVIFEVLRPDIDFTWDNLRNYKSNVFEVLSIKSVELTSAQQQQQEDQGNDKMTQLRLRGEMVYFKEFDCVIFMGMPIITGVEDLCLIGLNTSDLSKADTSRDILSKRSKHNNRSHNDEKMRDDELLMAARLSYFAKETNTYRQKRIAVLEETMPIGIIGPEDFTLEDYQLNLAQRAAVVYCHFDADAMLECGFKLQHIVASLNTFNSQIDTLVSKYANCAMKVFTTITSGSFVFVVGPPAAFHLPAHLALQISLELFDAVKQAAAHHNFGNNKQAMWLPLKIAIDVGPIESAMCSQLNPPRFVIAGPHAKMAGDLAQNAPSAGKILMTSRVSELLAQSDLNGHYSQLAVNVCVTQNRGIAVVTAFELDSINRDVLSEIAQSIRGVNMMSSGTIDETVEQNKRTSRVASRAVSSAASSIASPSSPNHHHAKFIELASRNAGFTMLSVNSRVASIRSGATSRQTNHSVTFAKHQRSSKSGSLSSSASSTEDTGGHGYKALQKGVVKFATLRPADEQQQPKVRNHLNPVAYVSALHNKRRSTSNTPIQDEANNDTGKQLVRQHHRRSVQIQKACVAPGCVTS